MSSSFIFVLLCMGSFAVMGAYHRVPRGFVRSNVPSRPVQCQSMEVGYIGECTMTEGKNFAQHLHEDSCKKLWCVKNIDDQRVCEEAGLPADDTPCGVHSVCRNATCVRSNNLKKRL